MKNTILIFLILLTTSQPFSKVWVVVSFEINREYISKSLCVNRLRPQLHCNGKCYLAQKLKKAEEQERKQIILLLQEQGSVLYCLNIFEYIFHKANWRIDKLTEYQSLTTSLYFSHFSEVFHPPTIRI